MTIASQLTAIKSQLPAAASLVAVSKTKPLADIMEAYEAGQRVFGENKIQEMTDKFEALPKDIEWHMIGHVQTNKVKYMAPYVSLIHGVDSFKLLKEIDKQARRNNRVINCLLQVYIAEEETKFGFDESEIQAVFQDSELEKLTHINLVGLMGMATFTEDENKISSEFNHLKQIFDRVQAQYNQLENVNLSELSMGMSNDYHLALSAGSTLVRIGSSLFGQRNY